MSEHDRKKWDAKYTDVDEVGVVGENDWLAQQVRGMQPGRALDLACGLGANAIRLAQWGWTVTAIDISPVGLQIAARSAAAAEVQVDWQAADLESWEPAAATFDLVTVFRYLDRDRLPQQIQAALKPGGTLLYETFVEGPNHTVGGHVRNPAFVLQRDELPTLFPNWNVIEYSEIQVGDHYVARLRSQKPAP
jgi:tellurite methyltransferase